MNKKFFCAAFIGMVLAGNLMAQNVGHYEVELEDGRMLKMSAAELDSLKNEKGTLSSYNFIEVQGGAQLTSTDAKMTDLFTPTAAFSVGRYFTPIVGARLHVNAWEAKSGFNDLGFYKWNYFTTNADVMFNLTNMFSKNKSGSHPLNVILLGGIGLTNSWGNEEAKAMAAANNNLNMPLVWDDNRLSHNIRAGLRLETNVTKPFGVSLEVNANNLDDRFNSKSNDADDWQFTAMLGLSFRFGHKNTKPVIVSEKYIALNNTDLLTLRVNSRMNDWMKMRDGETMDEYKLRVNDDTRAKQRLSFEYEIATEMAGNLISEHTISFSGYNPAKKLLKIAIDGLNSIMLEVPQDDVVSFNNPEVLTFSNTIYGLNDEDEFDIIYTEVYNPKTDKKYIYDNLARKTAVALTVDDEFVPLQLIQQSSLEEMRLRDIRKQVMEEAKSENLISDNTQINVSTEIVKSVDASGKSIMNYKVNYSYQVEQEFTAREDFKPGQYKTEESNAAMSMLTIIEKAFKSDFAQYIKPDKKLKIKITGSADAAPIRHPLPYDNCYGTFDNELVYQNGILNNVTINKSTGVAKNEELAFLRAAGLGCTIEKLMDISKKMNCEYEHHIELSNKTGGEYRRISVEFLFEDAF